MKQLFFYIVIFTTLQSYSMQHLKTIDPKYMQRIGVLIGHLIQPPSLIQGISIPDKSAGKGFEKLSFTLRALSFFWKNN